MRLYRTLITFIVCAAAAYVHAGAEKWTHLSSSNGDLPIPNTGSEQSACIVLDIDGDSINDFVIAERSTAPAVTWFRRTGSMWHRYIIEPNTLSIAPGDAFSDIDHDGDPDIVFGGDSLSREMWWWQNPRPNFDPNIPWRRYMIKSSGGTKHHDQAFGDIDNDGRLELVTWNQGLVILEVPDVPLACPNEWPRKCIMSAPGKTEGLAIADIDLDGCLDIIGGGWWFRHLGGCDFEQHIIDSDPNRHITRTAVGQLIVGGRPEVVLSPGDSEGPLILYHWDGGGWARHTLIDHVIYGHSLQVVDIDKDSHLDIFAAEMGCPGAGDQAQAWIFYGDGNGDFVCELLSVGIANHESKVADLDGDGDFDILTKPFQYGAPRLDIWLNNDDLIDARHLAFFSEHWLAYCDMPGSCGWADLDNDATVTFLDLAIFAQSCSARLAPTPISITIAA